MTTRLPITLSQCDYEVVIGEGLDWTAEFEEIAPKSHWVVLYDGLFDRLDEGRLLVNLRAAVGGRGQFVAVPSGEASKSLAMFGQLAEQVLAGGITRESILLAFGGGVVGDLAGFLAASLLRGVRFVQMPTTLLAQVDSSVGGKVGINASAGKNLIGAFYQPVRVLADLALLSHLPEREFAAGMAEILKAALLADADFWDWLEKHIVPIRAREADCLEEMIARAVCIKAAVVQADETERSGMRALLNLGHTFGHALEAAVGYDGTRLIHGEAVSIGTMMAVRLSANSGMLTEADVARIARLIRVFGLPIAMEQRDLVISAQELLDLMQFDKKQRQDGLQMVLLEEIGRAVLRPAPPAEQIRAAIESFWEV